MAIHRQVMSEAVETARVSDELEFRGILYQIWNRKKKQSTFDGWVGLDGWDLMDGTGDNEELGFFCSDRWKKKNEINGAKHTDAHADHSEPFSAQSKNELGERNHNGTLTGLASSLISKEQRIIPTEIDVWDPYLFLYFQTLTFLVFTLD